jgi:hypothetical protein
MEIHLATLKDFDAATYTATIQIPGSRSAWLDSVPVSRAIDPAEMVAGRAIVAIFARETNPTGAMIVGVH